MRFKLDNCVKDLQVNVKYISENQDCPGIALKNITFEDNEGVEMRNRVKEKHRSDNINNVDIFYASDTLQQAKKSGRSYFQALRHAMNLKLNNDIRGSTNMLDTAVPPNRKKTPSSIKEERRRNGRYIAILVGIMLFILAIYHAWVRRIPIVASLVVPALIMFVYVGWVLFTASRDKHRLLDAEAALEAEHQAEIDALNGSENTHEVTVVSSKEISKTTSEEAQKEWNEISSVLLKEVVREDKTFVKPVILINDRPPEDLDQKWDNAVETLINCDKLKGFQTRKKYKRKFCRSKRHAVFKRSYSIA